MYDCRLVGSPEMHPYHCRCEVCDFNSGFPFRAQRDSSCSGEVISEPWMMHHDDNDESWQEHVTSLQDLALIADAEPGYNSGFHVHVMPTHLVTEKARAVWAFLMWEPFLVRLAAGRFPTQRSNNTELRRALRPYMMNDDRVSITSGRGRARVVDFAETMENLSRGELNELAIELQDHHFDLDRHSNLNITTRAGTYEYRLWNSTRSAWRMELFARMSVALVDPEFVELLIANPCEMNNPAHSGFGAEASRVASLLDSTGHRRTAELLERQAAYLLERADSAPSLLVAV